MNKKKLIMNMFFIMLYFVCVSTKVFAAIEVDFVNQSGQTEYEWKNNKVYMEIQTLKLENGKEECNVIFLSTEFWENFYNNSYYDKENQIFYFYGIKRDIYVKSNYEYYHENEHIFSLIQNVTATPIVINEKLFIPLCLYRNEDMYNKYFGFDEESNTLIYYGPSEPSEFYEDLKIENVKILEEIYYNSENSFNDLIYISIELLKNRKDGVFEYYLAEINGDTNIIKVFYKYDALRKKYVYDRHEIVLKEKSIDGEFVEKINNQFIIVKKDSKYSLYDIDFNMLLENIYDEIVFEEGIKNYKNVEDNSLNNQLIGNFVKVKKDDKYALYSLDERKFILQENYYDQIEFLNKIDIYTLWEDHSKLIKNGTYNISNVYNADGKIGLIINNDLVTDIKYTKIEAIEIAWSYVVGNAIIIDDRIIAWKLYVDEEFYILTDVACSNEYFHVLNENIFLSKNAYKDMNIVETENVYTVYGIDDTYKENKLYDVEKQLDMKNGQNYYSYFCTFKVVIIFVCIVVIIFVCVVVKLRKNQKRV